MSLNEDLQDMRSKVNAISERLAEEDLRRVKKKSFRLPLGVRIRSRSAVKSGKILVLYFRANRKFEFRICKLEAGLVTIDDHLFKAYEGNAVYHYKKFPLIAIFEWRLLPVGGLAEVYESRIIGGEASEDVAKDLNISDVAQQTIVRVIEKVEVDKELGKKKGKLPIAWIIIGVGILIYLLAPMFGFGG